MAAMTPQQRLDQQVHVFNDGARSGDFRHYSQMFLPDGEMKLLGAPGQGRYHGRTEIAEACADVFSERAMRILSVISAKPESATVDYAWERKPKVVAGQMIVKWTDGLIRCLTVTL
jgi:hypothetical protein